MEPAVDARIGHDVAPPDGFVALDDEFAQLGELAGRAPLGGLARRIGLEHAAHLEHLAQFLLGQSAYIGPSPRHGLKPAVRHERLDGFAHGNLADAEMRRDLVDQQPLPGTQHAGEDRLEQHLLHMARQVPAVVRLGEAVQVGARVGESSAALGGMHGLNLPLKCGREGHSRPASRAAARG